MLSELYESVSVHLNSLALHRDIDISFFVITVDLWDEEAQKEVNLVKHAANSPSISTASAVAYPQTPTANVCPTPNINYPPDSPISVRDTTFLSVPSQQLCFAQQCSTAKFYQSILPYQQPARICRYPSQLWSIWPHPVRLQSHQFWAQQHAVEWSIHVYLTQPSIVYGR